MWRRRRRARSRAAPCRFRRRGGRHHLYDDDEDENYDWYLFFGGQLSRANLCACLLLQPHVAAELSKEAALAKERRKAQEERAPAKPNVKQRGEKGQLGQGEMVERPAAGGTWSPSAANC
eukprot:7565532-Pyramimonas_sp.AAC.1